MECDSQLHLPLILHFLFILPPKTTIGRGGGWEAVQSGLLGAFLLPADLYELEFQLFRRLYFAEEKIEALRMRLTLPGNTKDRGVCVT